MSKTVIQLICSYFFLQVLFSKCKMGIWVFWSLSLVLSLSLNQNILGVCLWRCGILSIIDYPIYFFLKNFFNSTYSGRPTMFVLYTPNFLDITDCLRMEIWQRVDLTHSMHWAFQIIFLEKLNLICVLDCHII